MSENFKSDCGRTTQPVLAPEWMGSIQDPTYSLLIPQNVAHLYPQNSQEYIM